MPFQMNLTYSPEQILLRDSAFRFLDDNYTTQRRNAACASASGHIEATWREFAALGWLGMPFKEEDGGFGGGAIETAILMEAFGRSLVIEPWLPAVLMAGQVIARCADNKARFLEPLIAGESYAVLAHIEREAGYNLAHVATEARAAPGGYVLQGRKTYVLGAAGASWLLVTARLPGDPIDASDFAVFCVARDAPGLKITPYRLLNQCSAAHVELDNVTVARADLIVERLPRNELERVFDVAIAAMTADAVGAMDALLATTIRYTKERKQFGKPIAEFQALRHRMAEMAIKCETAQASALLAALSLERPRDFRVRCVSGAKMKVGREARHVAQEAIQLHGAMGVSEEMPVGQWFKRLFVFENSFGSTAYHLQRFRQVTATPGMIAGGLLTAAEG